MSTTVPIPKPRQRNWAWVWIGYTGFLFIQPTFDPSVSLWLATLAAFAVFLVVFSVYVRCTDDGNPRRYWMIAATFALGLICFPWNQGASTFFVYAASFVAFAIPSGRRVLVLFAAECFIILAEGYLFSRSSLHDAFHISWPNTMVAIFLVLIIGGGNILFAEQRRAEKKLQLAQEENVTLAALAERERIARDLHDVLGHTLSVIVLKSELAGRLMERDPIRAAAEIADVERTARTALAEVREAIGGYRAKGLAAELEQARNTLASAGVMLSCESAIPRLAPTEETVLALAVREAVTNIVRHARAQHCRLSFETTPAGFHSLKVEDDGSGILATEPAREGNGLRGMRERVQSLGGRLSIANPAAGSGTTLTIELPIAAA
jgi:two-component system sensor histidine kinase DesK